MSDPTPEPIPSAPTTVGSDRPWWRHGGVIGGVGAVVGFAVGLGSAVGLHELIEDGRDDRPAVGAERSGLAPDDGTGEVSPRDGSWAPSGPPPGRGLDHRDSGGQQGAVDAPGVGGRSHGQTAGS